MCDECAHGWLDGLNRLFMEAKLLVWLHGGRTEKLIYAAVFRLLHHCFPKNFLHVCLNGKWSQEVNLGFSSPTLISDAKTLVFVSHHPSALLLKLPIEYI